MDRSVFSRRNWKRDGLMALGWLFVVGLAVGMVWYSFANQPAAPSADEPGDVTPPQQAIASPTYVLLPTATLTPTPQPALSLPTSEPTPIPPAPTPTPYIVAGADGVNVRTGPATSYEQIGYIDPDGRADYLGVEENWVQIRYEGEVAYVYGPLVTIVEAQEQEVETPTD